MKRTSFHHLSAFALVAMSSCAVAGAVTSAVAASPAAAPQSASAVVPAAVSFGSDNARTAPARHAFTRTTKRMDRKVSTKAYDPLAVYPSIAVKDTPAKEINLPGVMNVPGQPVGALDPTRAHPLSMTDGGVITIYMSVNAPNRIELPFGNSLTHHRDTLQVDKSPGQNIYVYWKNLPATEETMYIEPMNGRGPVLGLDIVPKDIPAQTYIVKDDTGILAGHQKPKQGSDDYIGHVQDVMESVALGHSPDGYSDVDMTMPPMAVDGLVVTVDKRFSSHEGDIYVYTARNPGQSRAVLDEREFNGADVLAVSIFPKPVLQPGESTRVIVMARKREEQ